MGKDDVVREVLSAAEANSLYETGKYSKPRYSEKRDCYVLTLLEERNQRVKSAVKVNFGVRG